MRFPIHSSLRVALTLLLVHVTAVTPVEAQTVTTYSEAVEWLDENQNNPQFGSVLYTAVEYAPSVEAVGSLLDEYLQGVMDRSDQGRILLRAGMVQELAHQYNRARLSYARAVEADPGLWEASLRRSALAIEEGDTSEAVLLLTQAIHQSPTREIQRRAAMIRIRAFAMQDDTDRAFRHAASLVGYEADDGAPDPDIRETVEPEALLLLYETAQRTGNDRAKEWSSAALSRAFDRNTPERSLAQNGESPDSIAVHYPSPSRIFDGFEVQSVPIVEHRMPQDSPVYEESETLPQTTADDHKGAVSGIQTGSFRDVENAQYMAEDIRKRDFSVEVREVRLDNTSFFRVMVPLPHDATPESAQATVVRLKEEGIEGFLIFESR